MSSQLKFFGHILRFEKDKPADIYTLQMMIMMISGMPGKSDGGQNANGVGQGICLLSLFSRTKRTMPLISWVRQGNNSMQISLVRIIKRKEISSMLLKNCWSRKMNFCSDPSNEGLVKKICDIHLKLVQMTEELPSWDSLSPTNYCGSVATMQTYLQLTDSKVRGLYLSSQRKRAWFVLSQHLLLWTA